MIERDNERAGRRRIETVIKLRGKERIEETENITYTFLTFTHKQETETMNSRTITMRVFQQPGHLHTSIVSHSQMGWRKVSVFWC